MSDEHSSPIKNWKQLLIVVCLAFLIPIILILIVTQLVTGHLKGSSPNNAAVLNRIKPVGEVVLAEARVASGERSASASAVQANAPAQGIPGPTMVATAVAASAPKSAAAAPAGKPDGKKIYDAVCMVCHAAGVAGAPKFGDKAAWAPRIQTGIESLHSAALKGKGAMPPKGGSANLSDADVTAAVDYMVSAAK